MLSASLLLSALVLTADAASPSPSAEQVPEVVRKATQKVTIPAREIPVLTLDGTKHVFGDFTAKVTVVELWSSNGCDPQTTAAFEKLAAQFRGKKDFTFLSIAIDPTKGPEDRAAIAQSAKENGIHVPTLIDQELMLLAWINGGSSTGNTMIRVPPFTVIVDGKVFVPREQGEIDSEESFLRVRKAQLLQAQRAAGGASGKTAGADAVKRPTK